jgi:hypothetical protein
LLLFIDDDAVTYVGGGIIEDEDGFVMCDSEIFVPLPPPPPPPPLPRIGDGFPFAVVPALLFAFSPPPLPPAAAAPLADI